MYRRIELLHATGWSETFEIVPELIARRVPEGLKRALGGRGLDVMDDSSFIKAGDKYVVFTSDSYTVNSTIFPRQ